MNAHVAIVFSRYMMLAVHNRESEDPCSLGELFQYFCEELAESPWLDAFNRLMGLFSQFIADNFDLSEEELDDMAGKFMALIPNDLKRLLKVA